MLVKRSWFGTAASSSCLRASRRQLGFVPWELEEQKGHEARAHVPRCPGGEGSGARTGRSVHEGLGTASRNVATGSYPKPYSLVVVVEDEINVRA